MVKERWRDVVSFEGLYKISNIGRVKSLKFRKERIISAGANGRGYKYCGLYKNGVRSVGYIHQLVAIAFLDHIPNGHTLVCDHKNGIVSDNRVSNLRIVSKRENSTTCYRKDRSGLTSKFAGVHLHRASGKWIASIQIDGKVKYIGIYASEIDAANAYLSELKLITS